MLDVQGLYAVTPERDRADVLLSEVEAVLRGGGRLVQYRDKRSSADEKRRRAASLAGLCRRYGATFLVNDDVVLAAAVRADGVHLGRSDGAPALARQQLGPAAIVGVSCYGDFDLARKAAQDGASYLAFGAAFPSSTKPEAAPVSLGLLRHAKQTLGLPVCAIGGITLANAAQVIAAGADCVAVITDLFSAADIASRSADYQQLFKEYHP